MQTCWPEGHPFYADATLFAQRVAELSDGALTVQVFPDGGIVGAFDAFAAVRAGTVELMHDWPYYWWSQSKTFGMFGSVPFGFDNRGYSSWLYAGGGLGLARTFYAGYGLIPFPAGNGGQSIALQLKEPITKLSDLAGKTIRSTGMMLDIWPQLGVNAVSIPASGILPALASGSIDGCEFASPSVNYQMDFHQYAKYAYMPGFQKPAIQLMTTVNLAAFNGLNESVKDALGEASEDVQMQDVIHAELDDAAAVLSLREAGVHFNMLSSSDLRTMRRLTHTYKQQLRSDPSYQAIFDSYESHVAKVSAWKKLRMGVATWPYRDYMRGLHTE